MHDEKQLPLHSASLNRTVQVNRTGNDAVFQMIGFVHDGAGAAARRYERGTETKNEGAQNKLVEKERNQ